MGIYGEIQKLNPSAVIDLYEVDATALGGDLLRFHPGTNEFNSDVLWQGNTYARLPIEITGFEKRSQGTLPRPVVRISNAQGLMAAEAQQYDYFLGAKVVRKRTFARFLDAANFVNGNPDADPDQHLPDEIWYVDRKANENPIALEFELASALDLVGVALPRRQVIQNTCVWVYRDGTCGYSGGPVADAQGNPTSDPNQDRCGKRLSDCKLRFGGDRLPFGGFPGAGLVK